MGLRPARPPFAGCEEVLAVLPTPPSPDDPDDVLTRLPALFAADADAITRELGAPVRVVRRAPADSPRWLLGPWQHNRSLRRHQAAPATAPTLTLDRERRLLLSDAPDADGLLETFSGLRNLARHAGGPLEIGACRTVDEAIERVLVEVHDAWPRWGRGGARWARLSERHVWAVRGAPDPARAITAIQRWLTELGDFHTWVRPVATSLVLPYGAAVVDGEVILTHVPAWTAGYAAGARPGDRLLGLPVRATWDSTPGAPHSKPTLVARRLLSGPAGQVRHLEARGPGARTARWEEVHTPPTGAPAAWDVLPSGVGYLWIGAFVRGFGVEEVIEAALTELDPRRGLIVDLRGNGGGRLDMALDLRDRFLRAEGVVGWIRTSEPGGRPGPLRPLRGAPHPGRRWSGDVRFLTSPLTYSSAEDCLLGLQGEPHVQVWGQRSGGGSGRLRRVRLFPGWRLTVTTSLTWDRRGHLIEGQGVPVDVPFAPDLRRPTGGDPLLDAAMWTPW